MAKKKKVEPVKMHQHIDPQGRVFGAPHPVDAEHKKTSTQKMHEYTLKRA